MSAKNEEKDVKASFAPLDPSLKVPKHLAVVMDGNGRWAQAKGVSVSEGHAQGAEALRRMVRLCVAWDIKYLSVFAFSTENWGREKEEVDALMGLMKYHLEHSLDDLFEGNVRLNILGDLTTIDPFLKKQIDQAIEATKDADKLTLNIAFNYGGRQDIVQAVKKCAALVASGELSLEEISPESFGPYLYTEKMPDPDLFIRTSGEQRISNFLLWQCAYSEFYFSPTLWPDFSEEDLLKAIQSYNKRERRYGLRHS